MKNNKRKKHYIFIMIYMVVFYGLMTGIVNADTNNIDRISGGDRYATANAISQKGWDSSEYAVLARGDDFADALCAGPLASKYNAPILMTKPNQIDESTLAEIKRLGVRHIYITGGTGAVSESVENTLKKAGIQDIKRLSGSNRYETSVKIAQEISSSKVVLATGENYPDALSISVTAAKSGMPILLTGKNKLPDTVKDYFNAKTITQTYIIGGEGVIGSGIEKSVPGALRLDGADRYATNINVIKNFGSEFDFSHIYIAVGGGPNGNEFADALTGAVLAAKTSSPLLLVSQQLPEKTKDYLITKLDTIAKITALGGEGAVRTEILTSFSEMGKTTDGMLEITPTSSITGSTQTITLTYTLYSSLDKGTIEYALPAAIIAIPEADTIKIAGAEPVPLTAEQVSEDGRKISLSGITLAKNQKIILTLTNKIVPKVGNFVFRVVADADGPDGARTSSPGVGNAAKTFISNSPELKGLSEQLISYNRPRTPVDLKGFVIHSTASPGATAQRIYNYFNSGDRQSSAHYVADWTEIVRMIPENEVAWHAGPTANHRYLSVEMCEPETKDPAKFQEVWNRTVLLVADACVRYGWNTEDNVFSHYGISITYHETDHTDPLGFLEQYGKKWTDLLKAIDDKILQLKQASSDGY